MKMKSVFGGWLAATLLLQTASFFECISADYYVSTSGNDSNPGTGAEPWRTIQHAADTVSAGDTVNVRGGTYAEQVNIGKSGSASGGFITFQNYAGESPVIDGSSLTPGDSHSALVRIQNQNYIVFSGFEIRNFSTSNQDSVPIGIFVTGFASQIQVLDNVVHDIEHSNVSSQGGNAHGIAVYGTDGTNSINNITISGNTVRNCTLGWSESMVLNGNVENFTVSGNSVHDNDNIGIDFIGWEGTAPSNDQARNGTVSGNTVYNISSATNPAYKGEQSAAGIYVDGGKDIVIERNNVYRCDFGAEVASENPGRTTTGVQVRDNLFWLNNVTGIGFGGYDTDRGTTMNCSFVHNTLYMNDTTNSGTGEIMIQMGNSNTISNNIICAGSQNIIMTNYFTSQYTYANSFNYNLYYCPGGENEAIFVWQDTEHTGFSAFKTASGQDPNSIFSNPLFVDGSSSPPNLYLQATSPAIGAGDPNFTPAAGETDYAGKPRVVGDRNDCGAYEYQSGLPAVLTMVSNPPAWGTTDPLVGNHNVTTETPIAVGATAKTGYVFSIWTADANAAIADADSQNTTVTLTGNATVTANFIEIPPQTTLTLSVLPQNGGSTTPTAGTHTVDTQVEIDIAAVPAKGYYFVNWTSEGQVTVQDPNSASTKAVVLNTATVTANFAEVAFLTLGSVLPVKSDQIIPGSQFIKKPKVTGTLDGNDFRLTVVDKVGKNAPLGTVNAEWKKKYPIYDKSVYNRKAFLGKLLNVPIPDMPFSRIFVEYEGNESDLGGKFSLACPAINSVSGGHSNQGDVFVVAGDYFGTRLPVLYVEYMKDGDAESPGYKKCKLDRTESLKYQNASRKSAKSCMVVYGDDPVALAEGRTAGHSEIRAEYPRLKATDIPTGYIILDNGIGLAAYDVSKNAPHSEIQRIQTPCQGAQE